MVVALAGVDRGPCRGVDDHVGPDDGDGSVNRISITDVESSAIGAEHLVTHRGAVGDEIVAELAPGTGDEDPHQSPLRTLSGSHHSRWSRYHSTVCSSP